MGIRIDIYYINLEVFIKNMGFLEIVKEEEKETESCGKEWTKILKHKELPFFAEHIHGQYQYDTEHSSRTREYEYARIHDEDGLTFRINVGGPYFPTIELEKIESILPFSNVIKMAEKGNIICPTHDVNSLDPLAEVLKIKITKTKILYGELQKIEARYEKLSK